MAEVIIRDDETQQQVARELLDQAEHPDDVVWAPRSNTPHGGVFIVPDDKVDELVARRTAALEASRRVTERRIDAMEERDRLLDKTGATPDELGIGAFSDGDRASLGMPGVEANEIDPARSGEQQRLEADARHDGVAEAQDAQVMRALDRAEEAETEQVEADIAEEDKAAADRARARKAARKTSAAQQQADAKAEQNTTEKE